MQAASALSTKLDPVQATQEACASARADLGDVSPDLAFLFFSGSEPDVAQEVVSAAQKVLSPGALIGCRSQGVAGGAREVEDGPAVAVWAVDSIGVSVFGVEFDRADQVFRRMPEALPDGATVLAIADPFTVPPDRFLDAVAGRGRDVRVIGGLASGGRAPGESRLLLNHEVWNGGAVVAVVSGARVEPLVSQGCTPIGSPATVTRAENNVIYEMGGQSPIERIRETYGRATPEERVLMQHGLHVGTVIDEYRTEFHRGDFLIRGVLGADPETGAVAVGDIVDVGRTVQFHVRDAASADEDLRALLAAAARPRAVLMFTCNGRGTNLFDAPDHDAAAVRRAFGDVPLAGFFCAGEFGPVGGRNFLHGFTASLAMFVED